MKRRNSKQVYCGQLPIGGDAPITIQSMTNTDTRDVKATIEQIKALAIAGCQIIRVAVPDMEAAEAIKEIKKASPLPVVADIHFDYRLAIQAIKSGADKIRINPGNIGDTDRVKQVIDTAKEYGIPMRIGVNGGSLEKELLEKYKGVTAEALAESAMNNIKLVEDMGFNDIVVSIKSSNVLLNHQAHMMIADQTEHPIHIGVTEAGSPSKGQIKSAMGIGALLLSGVGDTLRVSLTGDPLNEIPVAKDILKYAGYREDGVNLVSCPTCGRCSVKMDGIVEEIEKKMATLTGLPDGITAAVMGCEVNGPGEARSADIGMAFGKGKAALFKKGEIIKTIPADSAVNEFIQELKNFK